MISTSPHGEDHQDGRSLPRPVSESPVHLVPLVLVDTRLFVKSFSCTGRLVFDPGQLFSNLGSTT
jgi:hypothetical protein